MAPEVKGCETDIRFMFYVVTASARFSPRAWPIRFWKRDQFSGFSKKKAVLRPWWLWVA